ncbi:MAG: metallophosphoesterase [Nitrososphaerota archaeon]|nr:metallophosphoesterase [Nitrososphaerota archaeon]
MLIGAVSDSHDNLPLIEQAIQTLNTQKVALVLHAGDYISPFTIAKFKMLNCPLIGVFGNNDGDHELLKKRFSETENCTIHNRFIQITIENLQIGLLHGDETNLLNTLISCSHFDFVIHGHTHQQSITHKNKTLIINPGELCGYLTGIPTMALIDTAKKEASIIEL